MSVRVSAVATTAKKDAAATSSKLASSLTPEVAKDLYYDMVSVAQYWTPLISVRPLHGRPAVLRLLLGPPSSPCPLCLDIE